MNIIPVAGGASGDGSVTIDQPAPAAVPEPSTFVLVVAALPVGLAGARRRRRLAGAAGG